VAAAIDVRDGRAVGDAWQAGAAGTPARDALRRLHAVGVTVFEVTAIDRDGTLEGPDLELLSGLVELDAGQVIASGGIRSIDDLERVLDLGCAGAIVGRALYEGRIDLADAQRRLA
jgi:phosphoribosylformimino-5-aminoimidazole carboxamide ribotide isomerase